MRSFSLQQVRGKAVAVLDACDLQNCVRIVRGNGKTYVIKQIKCPIRKQRTALAKTIAGAHREFKSGKLRPATPLEIVRKIVA